MSTRISAELKAEMIDDAINLYGIYDKSKNRPEDALFILPDGKVLANGDNKGHEDVLEFNKLRRHMRIHKIENDHAIETFCDLTGARRIFGDSDDIYCVIEKPFEKEQIKSLYNFAHDNVLNVTLLVETKGVKGKVIPNDQLTESDLQKAIENIVQEIDKCKGRKLA